MSLAGTLIGPRRTVAVEHFASPPAPEAHEVALGATLGQPVVGEGMPHEVGVDPTEPGPDSPTAEHGGHTGLLKRVAPPCQPEVLCGPAMGRLSTQVVVARSMARAVLAPTGT